jgi:abelson tyrosine-protein kinase 1
VEHVQKPQTNEPGQGKEARVTPSIPPTALQSSTSNPEDVGEDLRALHAAEDAHDRTHDDADRRELMSTALAAKDDAAMINVLQIVQSEMPDAIKTLERALKRVVEDGQLDTEESTVVPPSLQQEARKDNGPSVEPLNVGVSQCSPDALDREFIEKGIKALRRLSEGVDRDLPKWTITQYEIDRKENIGVGFFSRVYRGTWCKRTVAVKVLSETTPRKMFLREVEIWKSLYHPNVLELFGASSTSGEPPWFLVREGPLS